MEEAPPPECTGGSRVGARRGRRGGPLASLAAPFPVGHCWAPVRGPSPLGDASRGVTGSMASSGGGRPASLARTLSLRLPSTVRPSSAASSHAGPPGDCAATTRPRTSSAPPARVVVPTIRAPVLGCLPWWRNRNCCALPPAAVTLTLPMHGCASSLPRPVEYAPQALHQLTLPVVISAWVRCKGLRPVSLQLARAAVVVELGRCAAAAACRDLLTTPATRRDAPESLGAARPASTPCVAVHVTTPSQRSASVTSS